MGFFLQRTQNKRYLRFHIAITVTGGLLGRGINAVGIPTGRELPTSFMHRGGFQGQRRAHTRMDLQPQEVFLQKSKLITNKHSPELGFEGSLKDSLRFGMLILGKLGGQLPL